MPSTDPTMAAEVAAFLRRLADAVEDDPALGERLASLARASGLALAAHETPSGRRPTSSRRSAESGHAPDEPASAAPDPFALLRERGEAGLREALVALDVPALRAIIRTHRLDPARISARWTARDRLVGLIAEQVRARANHGRAFERV